jgi:hypothetical protein
VRACRDGGLRPPSRQCRSKRHEGGSCASATCATRSPARRSVKSSGSSEIVKGVAYSPQVGNNLGRNPGHRADSFRSDCPRRGFGRVEGGAGSPMEGTSGAADLGLLRGSTGEAALAPDVSAQATRLERWCSVPVARRGTGGPRRRPRASGPSRVRELLPFAGVGRAWWDRQRRRSFTGGAPVTSDSPAGAATISRREVSEWIGLG